MKCQSITEKLLNFIKNYRKLLFFVLFSTIFDICFLLCRV